MKTHIVIPFVTALFVLLLVNPAFIQAKDKASVQYNKMLFLENKGQVTDQNNHVRSDINFKIEGNGCNVFIGSGQIHYQWYKVISGQSASSDLPQKITTEMYRLDMELIGANIQAPAITEQKQEYTENYFLPQFPKGLTAHSYQKIIYKNIYPHIDWVLYVNGNNEQSFKYDFIVHKGGNPKDIRIKYKGASSLQLKDGACYANTPMGDITEQKPYSYYAASKEEIPCQFVLANNVLSFDVKKYDTDIVIDPILTWGTYYGNPFTNAGKYVATSANTEAFMCGNATGLSNIATSGAHQTTYGGGTKDCFIVKFGISGNRIWGTYYGGNDMDEIYGTCVDNDGNLYITGFTYSTSGIATPGAQQTVNNGDPYNSHSLMEAFLAKFDPSNGQLIWGTYYGGLYIDKSNSVSCDNYGSVYIAGITTSVDSIATPGAFQTTADRGFLAQFNASNGKRNWATFYNGGITKIACSYDSSVYIGGATSSYTGVATTGSYQPTFAGGLTDAFVAKFHTSGTRTWGTYFGNSLLSEEVQGLDCDKQQNVYFALGVDIIKLDRSGAYQWKINCTNPPASIGNINSLFMGPDGSGYFTSQKAPAFTFTSFAYFGKFTSKGVPKWYIQIGQSGGDSVFDAGAAYGYSKYYFTGSTQESTGIATSNGFQPVPTKDTTTAFLQQFEADTNVYFKYPFVDTVFCAGDSIKIAYELTNEFNISNVFKIQLSDSAGNFTTPGIIGTKSAFKKGVISCKIPDTTYEAKKYKLRVISTLPADTFYNYDIPIKIFRYHIPVAFAYPLPICENSKLTLDDANFPYAPDYTWTGPGSFSLPSAHNVFRDSMKLAFSGDYIVTANNNGCIAKDTVTITVLPSPADAVISGNTSLCLGDTLKLHALSPTSGVTYAWLGPAPKYFAPQTQDLIQPVVEFADSGFYKVIAVLNGCYSNQDAVKKMVTIHPLPKPTAGLVAPLCEHDSIMLTATDTISPVTYAWTGPQGFTSNSKDTTIRNSPQAASGSYIVTTTTIHGCSNSSSTNVTVKPLPGVVDASSNSPVCSGKPLQLTANNNTATAKYNWSGPAGYSSNQQSPLINPALVSGSGTYTLTVDLDGCKLSDTVNVLINQTPDKPLLSTNSPVYFGETIQIGVTNINTAASYQWTGPNNYSSTAANNALNSAVTSMSGKYILTATIGNCFDTSSILIDVKQNAVQDGKSVLILPNPNKGYFKILASMESDSDVPFNIYTTDGKLVYSQVLKPVNKKLDQYIDITGRVQTGIYRLKIRLDGKTSTYSLLIE